MFICHSENNDLHGNDSISLITVKPSLSSPLLSGHPLLNGHLSNSQKAVSLFIVNLTSKWGMG